MLTRLIVLVIGLFFVITVIHADIQAKNSIKLKAKVGNSTRIGRSLNITGSGGLELNAGITYRTPNSRGLFGQIVATISSVMSIVLNILVNLLGAVGKKMAILSTLFANIDEASIGKIEVVVKSLARIISKALKSASYSIIEVQIRLKKVHQLSLLEKQKLLIDTNSVLYNLNLFKMKLRYGLKQATNAAARVTGAMKIKVEYIVTIFKTEMKQIDVQCTSAMKIRNILDGGITGTTAGTIKGTGSAVAPGSAASQTQALNYITQELVIVSNLLTNMMNEVKRNIDYLVALLTQTITNQETVGEIQYIVTDLTGLIPEALIMATTSLANIKLKLDIGVELSMANKQKLFSDMTLVSQTLLTVKTKLQLGLNAAKNVVNSKKHPESMKTMAQYAVATLTAQIAQIDIQISSATNIGNVFKVGSVGTGSETTATKINVALEMNDARTLNSSITWTDGMNALKGMVEQLLASLNNKNYNQIGYIVTQLSGTASMTWTSLRVSISDINGKILSGNKLDKKDKEKYLADISVLVKRLLAIKISYEIALNEAVQAVEKSTGAVKININSAVAELKEGITQIEAAISEAMNINKIVKPDAPATATLVKSIGQTGDTSNKGYEFESEGSTAIRVSFEMDESSRKKTVSQSATKPSSFDLKAEFISTNQAIVVIRGKTDELLANLKKNKINKVPNIVTELSGTTSKTWISITKYIKHIEFRLSFDSEMTQTDKQKYLADMTNLKKDLLVIKAKYDLAIKAANQAATKANKSVKSNVKSVLSALEVEMEQIDDRISEVTETEIKINGDLNPTKEYTTQIPQTSAETTDIVKTITKTTEVVSEVTTEVVTEAVTDVVTDIITGAVTDVVTEGTAIKDVVSNFELKPEFSSTTQTAAINVIRTNVDDLLANLKTNKFNKIEISVKQLKERTPETWVSIKKYIKHIRIKLSTSTELTQTDRQKYLADMATLKKNLLSVKTKYEQAVKAANQAATQPTKSVKFNVKSFVSELKVELQQIDLRISEVNETETKFAKDLAANKEYPTEIPQTSTETTVAAEEAVEVTTTTKVTDIVTEVNKDKESKPEESLTTQTAAINVIRGKVDELLANIKKNKFDKIETIVTQLKGTASKTWISTTKYIKNIEVRISSSSELTQTDKQKYLADIATLKKNLLYVKTKYDMAIKITNQAATQPTKSDKFNIKSVVSALKNEMQQIDARISEATQTENKFTGDLKADKKYSTEIPQTTVETTVAGEEAVDVSTTTEAIKSVESVKPLTKNQTAVSKKVDSLVNLFSTTLDSKKVVQIESIVNELKGMISTSVKSVNKSVADIKTKLKDGKQLNDSEKQKLTSNITSDLVTLKNLKSKIELAINTGKKSTATATGPVKTKADTSLDTLKAQITHIDLHIGQATQLQTTINEVVSETPSDIITGVYKEQAPKPEESLTSQTTALNVIKVKVDDLLTNLKKNKFDKIGSIVTQLSGTTSKISTKKYIKHVEYRLAFDSELTLTDKKKYLADIATLKNNLLTIKTKYDQAVKAANQLATQPTKSVKFNVKSTVSALKVELKQIDQSISEATEVEKKFIGDLQPNKLYSTEMPENSVETTVAGEEAVDVPTTTEAIKSVESVKPLTKTPTAISKKVDSLVNLFSTTLDSKKVVQIESIVTELKGMISTSVKSVNKSVADIKTKLKDGKQLNDSEKQKLTSNITSDLVTLKNLKSKIELAINTGKKSTATATGPVKTKADTSLDTLKAQITNIDLHIGQATQLQTTINEVVSETPSDIITGGTDESINEKSPTNQTADIIALRVKLDLLLTHLKTKKFNKIGPIVAQLSVTSVKTLVTINKFINHFKFVLSTGSQLSETDKKKFHTDITEFKKSLLVVKSRFELAFKAANEAAVKASKLIKFNYKPVVTALKYGMDQLEARLSQILQIEVNINSVLTIRSEYSPEIQKGSSSTAQGSKEIISKGTVLSPVKTLPTSLVVASKKVDSLVSLFSSSLTYKKVVQIESIVTDLKAIILTSMISVNTSVADIKAKLKNIKQLKDSEKLKIYSNIATVLTTLTNLKAKIELALNAAIKSTHTATGAIKTKAHATLVTLRTHIINIDLQIAQIIQLQINLNGGVSGITTGSETAVRVQETANIELNAEKRSSTQTTVAIDELGGKVTNILKGLNSKNYGKIEEMVTQMKTTASKAWLSVTTFITKIESKLGSGTKLLAADKQKLHADITALLKSLLDIKMKYVNVLKATNEAVTITIVMTNKTNVDHIMSSFSAQMAQIDARITEVLQTQFKLNGGSTLNFGYQTEVKQTLNVKGLFQADQRTSDTVQVQRTQIV